MTEKIVIRFVHDQARNMAQDYCKTLPNGWWATFQEENRTLKQNSFQWPYLEGFARTLQWPVNGEKVWLKKEEWKDLLTAAFEKETNLRIAQGWDGGVIMLGSRTSQFGKKKFAVWMEYLIAQAALSGVEPVFSNGWKDWQECQK